MLLRLMFYSLQHDREIAKELLGDSKVDLASFSFDGANAGMIVMNSKYDDYDFQVQYSLDGGNTWKATTDHKIVLTVEELNNISADSDTKLRFQVLIKCLQSIF